MKVKTVSEQPHLRSLETPYTSVTIRVDMKGNDKQQELEFLAHLVNALSPKVGLGKVNKALVQAAGGGLDFEGAERK